MKNEVFPPDVDYDDEDAQRRGSLHEHDLEMAGSAVMVVQAKSTSEHSALPREFSQACSGYSQASISISFDLIFRNITNCLIILFVLNWFMTYCVYQIIKTSLKFLLLFCPFRCYIMFKSVFLFTTPKHYSRVKEGSSLLTGSECNKNTVVPSWVSCYKYHS